MKKITSFLLSLSLVALISLSMAGGGNLKSSRDAFLLPDSTIEKMSGAGDWSKFTSGVVCGAGIVAIAAGALSGAGFVVAFASVVGVVDACVSAFDS